MSALLAGRLLAQIHILSPSNPVGLVPSIWQHIDELSATDPEAATHLRGLHGPLVMGHTDLSAPNLIDTAEGLFAIDFIDGGGCNPRLDAGLGAALWWCECPPNGAEYFLDGYHEQGPAIVSMADLNAATRLLRVKETGIKDSRVPLLNELLIRINE